MTENNKIIIDAEKDDKRAALKGMTLIEVIIAMLVLVITSSMVAVCGSGIVSNLRTSKSVIEKVNYQSKYVADKRKEYYDTDSATQKDVDSSTISFSLASDAAGTTKLGKTISVTMYEAPEDTNAIYKNYDRAGNLKFFTHPKSKGD